MIKLIFIVVSIGQISSSTSITTTAPANNSVKIFNLSDLRGENKTLDVSSCVSLSNDVFNHHVASIDTMGSCVILYSDYNCLGNGSLAATFSNTHNHNPAYYGFTINSLGPCRTDCSNPTFENGTTNVLISTNAGAEIFKEFTLITGECMNFPNSSAGVKGQISLSESLCIQMYEEEACKGSSRAFQSFSAYKSISQDNSGEDESVYDEDTKSYEIQPEKWQHSKSLSLCDFNCIGTKVSSNIPTPTSPPPTTNGHIVLWVIFIIILLLSIVIGVEVFRRYRNFKRHNPSSNEFTNFLSHSNREDSL